MYLKLAMRNVRKSYRDFLIYFFTLMFSVSLFYTFNSFQAQQEMMVLREGQNMILGTVALLMMVLSLFVAMVLAGLIQYANRFLIRRRKKEFGLYLLMGMKSSHISRILIYETLLIGIISLCLGLLLGVGLSQVLAVITANLMEVEVDFHVVFSEHAMIMTLVSFTLMFLLTMCSNLYLLRKQKLIDLINADQKHEKQRLHSFFISILLFVTSLVLLGMTYYLATVSVTIFGQFFLIILFLGSLGTILFFFSLTGFLLRFISCSKVLYFRNLHMFVLRQVHSRINSSYLSMSVVCLMLLLAIGALATGWNLNLGVADLYHTAAPYDMTYEVNEPKLFAYDPFDASIQAQIDQVTQVTIYESDVTFDDITANLEDEEMKRMFSSNAFLEVMPYSQYLTFCEQNEIEPIRLNDAQYTFYGSVSSFQPILDEFQKNQIPLTLFGSTLTPTSTSLYLQPNTAVMTKLAAVIVPDAILPQSAIPKTMFWNINIKEGVDLDAFQQSFDAQMKTNEGWQTVSKLGVYDDTVSFGMLFTYIGLYLGIVFLMASAVVLALQQLSEADRNTRQYQILQKIGVERKMMDHSIYEQVGLYFLLPLGLAVIHAYFGIQAVASSLTFVFDMKALVPASLISGGCIVSLYGIYYIGTVNGVKHILYRKK